MWLRFGFLVLASVAICRLLRADWDRTRLLVLIAIGAGWLLLTMPGVDALVRSGGRPAVEFTRTAAFVLGPFLLLAGACWGLVRLARECWSRWPELGTVGRSVGVAACLAVGLLIAILARSTPGVAEASRVAERATLAGFRAGWEVAWAALGEVVGGGEGAA